MLISDKKERQNSCRTIFRTKEISSGKGLFVAGGGDGGVVISTIVQRISKIYQKALDWTGK